MGGIYPTKAACTRLRLGIVQDAVGRDQFDPRLWTFLRNEDFDTWIGGGAGRLIAARRWRSATSRLRESIDSCDLAVVQREFLPYWSLTHEMAVIHQNKPLVWDVDDSLWMTGNGLRDRLRGDQAKYEWLARNSTEIWAGSEYVANWCADRGASNVHLIPTIPPRYDIDPEERRSDLLVWVGMAATQRFLEAFLQTHQEEFRGWRLLVVGGHINPIPGIDISCVPWSAENERRALAEGTIGLYPIDTSVQYTAGKSGLKALLYMAHGLPMIATDAGSVRGVFHEGCGFLVKDQGELQEAMATLADSTAWKSMSQTARATFERLYDPAAWQRLIAERLTKLDS